MVSKKDSPTNDEAQQDEPTRRHPGLKRRGYLKSLGAAAAVVSSVGLTTSVLAEGGGPPSETDWQLTFEDDFDDDALNTDNWALGWGWGLGAPGSKVSWARDRHVNVSDSMLRLTASHEDYRSDGQIYVGAVHSKNRVTVEPPVYFEARCQFIQGTGWQNAFWSKPNSEAWPPEIDVVEYLQPNASRADGTSHNLHYAASGEPGDSSTHQTVNGSYDGYASESEWAGNAFHVYGVEWRTDVIRHYVDGQVVEETTDPTVLESFNNGGAEYLMLSLNLDNVGTTDKSISWDGKEFLCDWVRVYDYAPDSGGDSTDTTTEENSTDTSTQEEHYLWARSGDGNDVSFTFEVGGGNLRLGSSGNDADYWIADDGMTAGGTTARRSQLPGFRFEGPITDLAYDGDLELYLDDSAVDPDSLVDASEPGPYGPDAHPNSIAIDGSGHDGSASYSITVSESVVPTTELNAEDSIDGQTAAGAVGGGTDEYAFSGEVLDVELDGDADVSLNGTRLDQLEIERSADSTGTVTYLIETTGGVMGISPTARNEESVTDSKIYGTVADETDTYWLSGAEILDTSTFGGSVDTTLNGERIDRTD